MKNMKQGQSKTNNNHNSKYNKKNNMTISSNKPGGNETGRSLGIYVHIPFCAKKCNYCDFLSAPAGEDVKKEYVEALLAEIQSYEGRKGELITSGRTNDDFMGRTEDYLVKTIFIGGGTPSVLDAGSIVRIMEQLDKVLKIDYDCLEATIELNPGTVTRDKLADYRRVGINRLSFGLQSVNDNELRLLGRIHSYEQFLANYNTARELGFDNINIDLMSALPEQTLASWEESLRKVVELKPEHISAYSLIIEEGTHFYELYKENGPAYSSLPDEETERRIYHFTREYLSANGYERYEISNYARPGYESRHNSFYWTGVEYLGLGLGSSSLIMDHRFNNITDLNEYIKKLLGSNKAGVCTEANTNKCNSTICDGKNTLLQDPLGLRENLIKLSLKDKMEEFIFLGLRMQKGISKKEFADRFGRDIASVYADVIQKHIKNGLLIEDNDRLYLSEQGIDISNYLLADFILD